MRTFHEEQNKEGNQARRHIKPIRLSYHGNEHYNSIIQINDNQSDQILPADPGELEERALKLSR